MQYLSSRGPVVDIGAWIGPVTLWALELEAKVIAIEPDPVALEELKKQVAGKGEVEIWEGACAPFNGELGLVPYLCLGDSMTRVGPGAGVPCWTLEHILGGRVPALVRWDIEGYEMELLPTSPPSWASWGFPCWSPGTAACRPRRPGLRGTRSV